MSLLAPDASPPVAHAPGSPLPAPANLVETACADLQARWAAGERIPVEGYLLRHPELSADADAVLELVLLEVALREEAGETPSLAELTGRFPHLSELLRRQLALHGLLNRPAEAAGREFRVADYVLIREIGRGGMGTVYEARHRIQNQCVALKMLPGTFAPGAHELERFATEAEALTRLQHPHIVRILEVGLHQSQPFIAFELIEGGTLAERLRQGLPAAQASVALVATLAWAVEAVHQHGIVHRDLKPANILLLPAKETDLGVPKIADFGLAKLVDSSTQLTRSGDVLGTPAYLAPEQVSRWIILVGLLALGGCGGRSMGKVSGTVSYQGTPIPEGTIIFMVPGARDATGQIKDGQITEVTCFKPNDGVVPGTARLVVYAFATPATAADAGYMGMNRKSLIPTKYRDPATSKLTFEIHPGTNTLTIDLSD